MCGKLSERLKGCILVLDEGGTRMIDPATEESVKVGITLSCSTGLAYIAQAGGRRQIVEALGGTVRGLGPSREDRPDEVFDEALGGVLPSC